MSSRLIVNSIRHTGASSDAITLDSAGKCSFPNGGAGKILQVVNVVKQDAFSSTTSGSFQDITGLSLSITPSSNSSKILVATCIYGQGEASSGSGIKVICGSTEINPSSSGSRLAINGAEAGDAGEPAHAVRPLHNQTLLFSPASTSAQTVKAQFYLHSEGGTFYINRSDTDGNNAGYIRTVSTITAMEVAA